MMKHISGFKKAANQEHVTAISWLGYMEMYGYGRDINYKEAKKQFELAASYNDGYSQNKLGLIYYEGHGVTIDYKKAYE